MDTRLHEYKVFVAVAAVLGAAALLLGIGGRITMGEVRLAKTLFITGGITSLWACLAWMVCETARTQSQVIGRLELLFMITGEVILAALVIGFLGRFGALERLKGLSKPELQEHLTICMIPLAIAALTLLFWLIVLWLESLEEHAFFESQAAVRDARWQAQVARAEEEAEKAQVARDAVLFDHMIERQNEALKVDSKRLGLARREQALRKDDIAIRIQEERARAQISLLKEKNYLGAVIMQNVDNPEIAFRLVEVEAERALAEGSELPKLKAREPPP